MDKALTLMYIFITIYLILLGVIIIGLIASSIISYISASHQEDKNLHKALQEDKK